MKKFLSLLLTAVVMLAALSCAGCGGSKSPTVMVVNDVEIPQGVMNYYINAGRDYLTSYGINVEDGDAGAQYMSMIEEQAVDIVTEIAVVRSLARDKSLTVDEAALSETMDKEKANFGTDENWQSWLDNYQMTENDVKWILEYQLLADALYNQLNEDLTLPDDEIAEIYNADPDKYDTYKFAHILISVNESDAIPEGAENEAAQPDETKLAQLWDDAKATAEGLIQQINSGEAKFEDLAGRYNADSTKTTGGDLGQYVTKAASPYVSEFTDAAFTLTEIGQITAEPVRTSFGYHIIKLLDKTTGAGEARKAIIDEKLGDERQARYSAAVEEAMNNVNVSRDYERQYAYTPAESDNTENGDNTENSENGGSGDNPNNGGNADQQTQQ